MNTDFGAYIKELVKKFSENGISAEEKSLQYGCQLVLAKGTDKAVLSVYNGKKGIKFVWNGKNAEFTQACKNILADGSSTGTNYCLLKDLPGFNGIWAGSDESGKGDFSDRLWLRQLPVMRKALQGFSAWALKTAKLSVIKMC